MTATVFAVSVFLFLTAEIFAEPQARDSYLPPDPGSNAGAPGGAAGGYPAAGAPGGAGAGGESEPTEPANYKFNYTVKDDAAGNDFGHTESREGDKAVGMYYVVLPDGRKQIVEYVADVDGYKPKVTYEGEAKPAPSGPGSAGGEAGYPAAGAPSGSYGAPPAAGAPSESYGAPQPPAGLRFRF